jgi:hypothetical protein
MATTLGDPAVGKSFEDRTETFELFSDLAAVLCVGVRDDREVRRSDLGPSPLREHRCRAGTKEQKSWKEQPAGESLHAADYRRGKPM